MTYPLFHGDRRYRPLLGAALLGLLVGVLCLSGAPGASGSGSATAQTNMCVDCHRRVETMRAFPVWARDQITHWYGAVHGRMGVTCEQCHGGDARAVDKDEAHQGVVSPRNPRSPLSYRNVPELCGKCHGDVYRQFTQSSHYQVLKAEHLAPSCTTCHGFEMDMDAVTPSQLARRCALCHNAERKLNPEFEGMARAALENTAEVERAIERAKMAVDFAREQGLDPAIPAALVDNAHTRLRKTGELWHRFELEQFSREMEQIREVADNAYVSATGMIVERIAPRAAETP